MADSAVVVTSGTGTNIDTRTEGTNGNHRQVIVVGDPATNAGVAPVDATAGLKVNLGADNDISGTVTANAGTDLNTSALALETGGNLAAIKAKTDNIPALGQALAAASVPVILPSATITTLTPPAAITGFATAANQLADGHNVTVDNSTGAAAVNIQDGGNTITVDGTVAVTNTALTELAAAINTDKLDVNIVSSDVATGGTSAADDADFIAGTTTGTPAQGVYESTPTSVTDGDLGTVGITAGRRLKTSATVDAALPAGTNAIGKLAANSGVDIGDVDVISSALPTGASTLAKQDTIIGHLDGVETLLGTIDADTSNLSVVGGGTEATAIRVTIANNSTGVLSIDDNGGIITVDGTVTADLGATDNAVLDAIAASTAAIETAVEGTLTVTGGGGGTEYTEDVATANPIVGKAIMMERDDVLSSVTPIEGDNIGLRGTAEGALWTQDFNSDAILADTTAILADTAAIEIATEATQAALETAGGLLVNLGANNDVTVTGTVDLGATDNAVLDSIAAKDFATQTTLAAMNAKMVTGTDIGDVTINNSTGAAAVNIQDGGNTITVDGTVTANLSATDNAVLDDIAAKLATIDADTSALSAGVSTEYQVDVVGALPAGTNAIGKLAANSGVDIGDVTLTAGTAEVGSLLPPDTDVTAHTNYMRKYYTSATPTDGIIWSPAAGKRWHVVTMYINVSAASTITLEDDKSGGDDPVWKGEIAANSGVVLSFTEQYPMASGEDAADLTITATAGTVYVTCVGYEI